MEHLLKPGIYKIIDVLAQEKKSMHLRELARKTQLGMQTITRTLSLLLKEEMIIEQKTPILREFHLNYADIKTQSILQTINQQKIKKLPRLVQAALQDFCDHHDHQFIVLFGSYAKGTQTKDSDIDIFVYATNMPTTSPNMIGINKKYGVRINPIFSNTIASTGEKHILETAIPISNHTRYYDAYSRL